MNNYAGRRDVDDELAAELTEAGIEVLRGPESVREGSGEVKTVVVGMLHGWLFKRLWY